jgi:hypothetical protein
MSHTQYCSPEMKKSSKRSQSKTVINMMESRELRPMGLCDRLSNEANLPMHSVGHLPLLRTDSHGEGAFNGGLPLELLDCAEQGRTKPIKELSIRRFSHKVCVRWV